MARSLAPEKCIALHFLHTFSGCDTVSSFANCEKRTVLDILKTFNDVSPAFCTLASTCSSVDDQLDILDRSVVLLYDRASSEEKVNVHGSSCSHRKATSGWPSTDSICTCGTHKESR